MQEEERSARCKYRFAAAETRVLRPRKEKEKKRKHQVHARMYLYREEPASVREHTVVCETRGRPFASLQYVSALQLPFLGFMPKEERTEEEGSVFLSSH